MECLGGYTFHVISSVILSGGVKMRVEHGMPREVYIFCHAFCHTFRSSMECLGRYTFIVMTSVILSGGMKMRDEHGMLREVCICTLFLLCRFIYRFICSLPGSTFICRLICSLQTVAMPHPLRPETDRQKHMVL